MKLEYVVVYENSSDEFDIEHHRIKVKVPYYIRQIKRTGKNIGRENPQYWKQ